MAEEYCWAITQAAGRHAAADNILMFWSFDFNWTSFNLLLPIYVHSISTCAGPSVGQLWCTSESAVCDIGSSEIWDFLSMKVTGEHGCGKFFIKITLHNIFVSMHVSVKITDHTFNKI